MAEYDIKNDAPKTAYGFSIRINSTENPSAFFKSYVLPATSAIILNSIMRNALVTDIPPPVIIQKNQIRIPETTPEVRKEKRFRST